MGGAEIRRKPRSRLRLKATPAKDSRLTCARTCYSRDGTTTARTPRTCTPTAWFGSRPRLGIRTTWTRGCTSRTTPRQPTERTKKPRPQPAIHLRGTPTRTLSATGRLNHSRPSWRRRAGTGATIRCGQGYAAPRPSRCLPCRRENAICLFRTPVVHRRLTSEALRAAGDGPAGGRCTGGVAAGGEQRPEFGCRDQVGREGIRDAPRSQGEFGGGRFQSFGNRRR